MEIKTGEIGRSYLISFTFGILALYNLPQLLICVIVENTTKKYRIFQISRKFSSICNFVFIKLAITEKRGYCVSVGIRISAFLFSILRITPYLSMFSPNDGKMRTRITPNMDILKQCKQLQLPSADVQKENTSFIYFKSLASDTRAWSCKEYYTKSFAYI